MDAISELLVEAGKKPGQPEEWALLTYAYAMAGETNEALQAFAKLTQLGETRFVEPCWMAVAWTGLGNHDKASYYLNQAYQAHSSVLPLLQVQPVFDPLRSDPAFRSFCIEWLCQFSASGCFSPESRKPRDVCAAYTRSVRRRCKLKLVKTGQGAMAP